MVCSRGVWSSALALAVLACSPPTDAPDGGVQLPDANVRPDAARPDAGQALGVVTIVVRDESGPLPNADVVIDDANGDREVGITGMGGRVMMSNVAWGTGRITITASSAGHPLTSLVGFRRAELASRTDATGAITVTLVSYYHAFAVHGNVLNSADPTRAVQLFADVAGTLTVTGTSFSGEIARDTPFHVWALDTIFSSTSGYHYAYTPVALVRVDHAALTTTATFDVDMSAALPLTTIDGSFPAPADGNPAQSGYPQVWVTTDESYTNACLGISSRIDISADGTSFDFTVAQVPTADTGTPVTLYSTATLTHLYSQVLVDGLATSHAIASATEWPSPPLLVTPGAGASANLHVPIELMGVEAALPVRITLSDDYGAVWYLDLPAGATSAAFPEPPAGTDMTYWTNLHADIEACEPWPGHRIRCRRRAVGDSFLVTL